MERSDRGHLLDDLQECLSTVESAKHSVTQNSLHDYATLHIWANMASRLVWPMLDIRKGDPIMADIKLELDSLFDKIIDDRNTITDENPPKEEVVGMLTSYIKRLRIMITKAEEIEE